MENIINDFAGLQPLTACPLQEKLDEITQFYTHLAENEVQYEIQELTATNKRKKMSLTDLILRKDEVLPSFSFNKEPIRNTPPILTSPILETSQAPVSLSTRLPTSPIPELTNMTGARPKNRKEETLRTSKPTQMEFKQKSSKSTSYRQICHEKPITVLLHYHQFVIAPSY